MKKLLVRMFSGATACLNCGHEWHGSPYFKCPKCGSDDISII